MQQYRITIVSPGTSSDRPVLLVPFEPSALVTAFVDEVWKRVQRRGLQLEPNTHIATLHLDSETGAIIDVEDILSDVVTDPKTEKIFAVFKDRVNAAVQTADVTQTTSESTSNGPSTEDMLSVRVITPQLAKDPSSCPVLRFPTTLTVKQLHDQIAEQLHIHSATCEDPEVYECNCKLANKLADEPHNPAHFILISGKSVVERLTLSNPTETALKESLRARFGVDVEQAKRVALVGAQVDFSNPGAYKKAPIAVICSRARHAPAHARFDAEETSRSRSKTIDLHTSEQPIHPACFPSTIKDLGLETLAVQGAVDIYAVSRSTTGNSAPAVGKSSIYRSRAHWSPRVQQSDRGIAMFLSSLRVFISLVEQMQDDERSQDAVLHVIDLLTKFPPAIRAFYIMVSGKTPTLVESAAISHAMFEVLDGFVPTELVGHDHSRVFEGARLLFGFILDHAKSFKLPDDAGVTMPYLDSHQVKDFRDFQTQEPVWKAMQTQNGLIEHSLFRAFEEGGLLVNSHLQSFLLPADIDAHSVRQALLAGGTTTEVTVFRTNQLNSKYRYRDEGDAQALDLDQLSELSELAELCARNKLAVHSPGQLASAVAPCLTFDRAAHLAVHTGEQPCGNPGQSSIIFRPAHGQETINAALLEQLIAPLLKRYSEDGTAVFDNLGGTTLRRLQAPHEILMICVDTSASMRDGTDFGDIEDDEPIREVVTDVQQCVDPDFYNRASLDDMKERLCEYEGFADMIAIVATASQSRRRRAASQVIEILRLMLSSEIIKKTKKLETTAQGGRGRYFLRQQLDDLRKDLDKVKEFWASLKTHEDALCDWLIFRSTCMSNDISRRWIWSIGEAVPARSPPQQIPTLDAEITTIPHHLRCPITQNLMEDAVYASDGHIYSHPAIRQWFEIRKSQIVAHDWTPP